MCDLKSGRRGSEPLDVSDDEVSEVSSSSLSKPSW
jgi:hypothetical protein